MFYEDYCSYFTDPSPVQLIVQFLQQADAHVVKEPLPPIPSGEDQQGENIIDKHVS